MSIIDQKDISFYITSLFGIASVFTTYKVIKQTIQLRKIKSQIKFVENTDIFSPSEIVQQIKKHQHRKFHPIKDKHGNIQGYSGRVLLSGTVRASGQPIITEINESFFKKKTIQSINILKFSQQIYSNDKSDPNRDKYKINLERILSNCTQKYSKQFYISQNKTDISILNYDRINYQSALEIIRFTENKRKLQFHQHILTLGLVALKFIVHLFFKKIDDDQFRGISIGTRDMEVGIKVGSIVGVLGEIIYDTANGKLRIQRPQLIINDRFSYLQNLKNNYEILKNQRNFICLLACLSSLVVGRQIFKYLKRINKLPQFIKKWLA